MKVPKAAKTQRPTAERGDLQRIDESFTAALNEGQNSGPADAAKSESAQLIKALAKQLDETIQSKERVAEELGHVRMDAARRIKEARTKGRPVLQKSAPSMPAVEAAAVGEETRAQQLADAEKERAGLAGEIERLRAQIAEAEKASAERTAALSAEIGALKNGKDSLAAELAQARENAAQQIRALTSERDAVREEAQALAMERDELTRMRETLSAEAAAAKKTADAQIHSLVEERDALVQANQNVTAELAQTREAWERDTEAFRSQGEELAADRDAVLAELHEARATHRGEADALIAQRDAMALQRDELAKYRSITQTTHERELQTRAGECEALSAQRDEVLALLAQEREFHTHELAAADREKETVSRERAEAVALLVSEQKTLRLELEKVAAQRENAVRERDDVLRQLGQMRDAQSQKLATFAAERDALLAQRADALAQLHRFSDALGEDRVAALQAHQTLVEDYEREKNEHAATREEFARRLDEVAQERDRLLGELQPFLTAQRQFQQLLGVEEGGKFRHTDTLVEAPDGVLVRASETATGRDLVMKLADPDNVYPFLAEARILSRLEHPGIPPLYELGVDEHGQAFYTSRMAAGLTLRVVLDDIEGARSGTAIHFTLRRLLIIFQRVCDAVAYAHSRGIAHGHLRPDCVVLGGCGEVFVTDWARAEDENVAPATHGAHRTADIIALGRMLREIVTLTPSPDRVTPALEPAGTRVKKRAAHLRRPSEEGLARNLTRAAERAIGSHGQSSYTNVKDFQREVDAFSCSFEDPVELRLRRRHFRNFTQQQKWLIIAIAAMLLLIALAWLAATHSAH